MAKTKGKKMPPEPRPPTDEEIESESEEPHPEEPAAKSRARKVTHQHDHEDPPELLAGADDEDGPPPGTRERGRPKQMRLIQEVNYYYINQTNARLTEVADWVETGRRKSQTDTAMAPEKPVPKVGPPKGGHAKGKGSKGKKKGNEIEEESDARGVSKAKKFMEFGPVVVGSEDSSVHEDKSMDELDAEFDLWRSRLASAKSTKRKRDASQHTTQEHEGIEQTSSPGVHTRRETTRVTAPAHKKCRQANRLEVLQRRSNSTGFLPVGSHREPFSMTPLTGGKGVLTQWVHCTFWVLFERYPSIHPNFTHWVHGGYFVKVPTQEPNTQWVLWEFVEKLSHTWVLCERTLNKWLSFVMGTLEIPKKYLVGNNWANSFKTHNELTMYPLVSDSGDTEIRPASKPPQPVTKRAKRALETAAREKPAFVDDGDDNEVDEKMRAPTDEKTTVATGKKPKLAGSDPLFQLVWRWVGKELKRSVFFSNPFPDSEEYDLLPLDVYTEAARQVSKIACYKDTRSRAKQEYNTDWSSSLTHRLSSLRAALKAHTVNEVRAHFKALGHDRRKALLDENEYWFKLTTNGQVAMNAPFMNPVLQSILRKGLFSGRAGLYKLFPEEFDGESDEKEVPAVLVALAATFAYMALDDYVNNSESISWNYNSPDVAKVYHGHLEELERIKSKRLTSYHALLRKFFSGCVGKVASTSTGTARKPKTDYQNLPDSFSD
ncbi:hypothetical protein BJ322DRAFT_1017270 [Thelephora terrestris]|uniref:DUF6532 domain-containing protein n=1 Tax=Thelephora terrestris TaxID=56493 RepID=A0A9P6LAY2_9AGAM|nr:hypothetical protein BJ322DRAFT_1017270 [Thelephora terrestris]